MGYIKTIMDDEDFGRELARESVIENDERNDITFALALKELHQEIEKIRDNQDKMVETLMPFFKEIQKIVGYINLRERGVKSPLRPEAIEKELERQAKLEEKISEEEDEGECFCRKCGVMLQCTHAEDKPHIKSICGQCV